MRMPSERVRIILEVVFFALTVVWMVVAATYGFSSAVFSVLTPVVVGGSFAMSVWALRAGPNPWAAWRRRRHP
jgi:hypothetical protein